jgi:hypothetical protein
MPQCHVCAQNCPCRKAPSPVGSGKKACKKEKGGLWIHVLDDVGDNVRGAVAQKDGAADKATDAQGLAVYDPLDAKKYTASLKPLSPSLAEDYEAPTVTSYPVSVKNGQITYVNFELKRKVNLVTPKLVVDKTTVRQAAPEIDRGEENVHVFWGPKKDGSDVVKVTASYEETLPKFPYTLGATFSAGVAATYFADAECKTKLDAKGGALKIANDKLKAGFTFYVRADAAGEARFSLSLEVCGPGRVYPDTAPAEKAVTVTPSARVTPKIAVEHLVVLRDRELYKLQRKADTEAGSAAADAALHIHPDATRIELALVRSSKSPAYSGKGKVVVAPANVALFSDEECTKAFDASTKITFADDPVKLWMRGTAAGKFEVSLELDASTDEAVVVEGPAKGELGCVDLKLKLFHYKKSDVDKAINPDVDDATTYWNELKGLTLDQVEMTDAERVGTGRVLHVQKDENHARAKLVLERVAGEWPAAAKDYKVVLAVGDADKKGKKKSGALKAFDKAYAGSEVTLPRTLALADVDKNEPVFVEGATKCDGWRGIRVSAGIDRDAGGPEKRPKMDADWGAFTVVRIREVKCDVDNVSGKEKFVEGDKIFINLDADGRLLKSVSGNRKAEVTATIEPALADLEVFFSVVEHAGNYKIAALPADFKNTKLQRLKHTLKGVDRSDRKKLLTMSAKTDEHGKAKIETLKAPQLGLLKFKIGAYLLCDPEHARYVDEHADLKKRAPVLSATWLEVWRRLFFGVVAMKRRSGADYLDRFDEAAILSKMNDVGLKMERVGTPVVKPYKIVLPDVLSWSRAALGGTAPARTQYLCLVNAVDLGRDRDRTFNLGAPSSKTPAWNVPYLAVRDPGDNSTWLKSCKLTYPAAGLDVDIAGAVTLTQTGDFQMQLTMDLGALWQDLYDDIHDQSVAAGNDEPTAAGHGRDAANEVFLNAAITLDLKEADSPSGVSWGEAVVVCMDTREPNHATQSAKDSATHTFLHEVGHYLGLTAKFLPDEADTLNPCFYSEQSGEVSARGRGGYGVGTHCDGLNDECIVWYMFKMTLAYCETCNLFLRARDFHAPKVTARDKL